MSIVPTLLDLPVDILYLIFPYLDVPSFVALTSTCKALYNSDISEQALFWSSVTRSTFRVPNQPVVEGDGKRWKALCKRMLTQSRVYTWGNNEKACLGHSQVSPVQLNTLGPGMRRRMVMRSRHVSFPTELRNIGQDYGVVADMQCGGWSTTFLTSRGVLYSVGVMDGLQFRQRRPPYTQSAKVIPEELHYPAGFPYASQRYTAATAIKQFSAGRAHVLALSDSRRIWSWSNIDQTALHVMFLTVELKETTQETEIGHVKKVVAGWNKSAALVVGSGIVIWDPLSRAPDEAESEEDGALVLVTATVPRTNYQRAQGSGLASMLSGTHFDAEVGEVENFIVLEHYVVFNTHLGKVFVSKILWSVEEQRVTDALEIPLLANRAKSAQDPNMSFATDIQGSFQRFAIFTRSGAVLTSNQDHIDTFFAAPNSMMHFQRIPALQSTNVISIAFGDYHFHALHSPGYITSYGSEPQGCGCLGLGGHGDPEGRLRGLRYQGIGGDGRLVTHAYTSGRRIWFEEEKKRWITFLTSGGKDPEEARERIRMCADVNVQGEVSEWVEQEGRAWEARFGGDEATETDTENDGLATHFALSVTAAGWHSGALVLVNEDKAAKTRKGCVARPPRIPKPFDEGNNDDEMETEENHGILDRILDRVSDHARWFLGLPTAAEEHRAAEAQPNHLRPFTIPVNHGAETPDGEKYAWSNDSFPRLRLSDGREMPGEVDFHEWRNPRPEWDLTTQY